MFEDFTSGVSLVFSTRGLARRIKLTVRACREPAPPTLLDSAALRSKDKILTVRVLRQAQDQRLVENSLWINPSRLRSKDKYQSAPPIGYN